MARRFAWMPTLVVLIVFTLLVRAQQHQPEPTVRPYGRYTAQQVLAMTGPLCHVIAPEAGPLQFQVDRSKDDFTVHRWYAGGRDATGEGVVRLAWDADTGELNTEIGRASC